MQLRWLGTAGFEINIGNTTLYLDPYLSRGAKARPRLRMGVEDIAQADYVFLSHGHFDHAMDAPAIAARTGARVLAPSGVCDAMRVRGLPDPQLRPLEGITTLGFSDFRVRTIPSSHVRFDRTLALTTLRRAWWRLLLDAGRIIGYPVGGVMGYLFTAPECSWCFLGTAGYDPDLIRDLAPDVALIPVQGRTDIHRVAAEMVALMSPRWVIPHHHDDFYPPVSKKIDLGPFVDLVEELSPETQVFIPEIDHVFTFERGAFQSAAAENKGA